MTAARWSLADTHCPWCELPIPPSAGTAGAVSHRTPGWCWGGHDNAHRAFVIALRGELEAERALADDLAYALRQMLGTRNRNSLRRWEAARA